MADCGAVGVARLVAALAARSQRQRYVSGRPRVLDVQHEEEPRSSGPGDGTRIDRDRIDWIARPCRRTSAAREVRRAALSAPAGPSARVRVTVPAPAPDAGAGASRPRRGSTAVATAQGEPVEGVRPERQEVGQVADRRELACGRTARPGTSARVRAGPARRAARSATGWRRPGSLSSSAADEGQHPAVVGSQELERAAAERLVRLRRAISRFIHHSSECGLFCCASTLTAS